MSIMQEMSKKQISIENRIGFKALYYEKFIQIVVCLILRIVKSTSDR